MARFLLRRVLVLGATMVASSFIIFSALSLAPGSPIAALSGGRSLSPESVAILEHRFHLDQPFFERYWNWLTSALHGDFGYSIVLHQDVGSLITAGAGTTALLVAYASLIIIVVGIGLGIAGALRPGLVDTGVLVTSTLAAAVPSFVIALALITIFAVNLGWFPALGPGDGFGDQIYHLTLPAFALAGYSLAIVARVTRTSVREESHREHVQTAVSRGIPYPYILRRHILRNAAIPITTVVGITIASLIALAAVVERTFSLNGLGYYLINAARSKDFAVVQGVSLVIVAAFIVVNLLVDIAYAVLDPRITLRRERS